MQVSPALILLPPLSGTQNGSTPLILASYNGRLEVVKSLVSSGADVNAKNNVGDSREEVADDPHQV